MTSGPPVREVFVVTVQLKIEESNLHLLIRSDARTIEPVIRITWILYQFTLPSC